jgi:hypothetical protein
MNTPPTALELKKQLVARGFEVYRTIGNQVLLAERVRDNLIMDANVAAVAGEPLLARASFRAQQSDFHGAPDTELFSRARQVAKGALDRGYCETGRTVVPIVDPGDRSRTLDTWYEITVERSVTTIDELVTELRYLVGCEKVASEGRGATG